MAFERCLCLVLGDAAYHAAGGQDVPAEARQLLLKAFKKLRERVDNIMTMDEDLRAAVRCRIGDLEGGLKACRAGIDWMRLAIILLELTARLLGYADADGKVHRQVVFFRTKEQEVLDYWRRHRSRQQMDRLLREKHALVHELTSKGFSVAEIAQILGTSEYLVHQVLKDALLDRVAKLQADGVATGVEIAERLDFDQREVCQSLSRLSSLSAIKRKARFSEI